MGYRTECYDRLLDATVSQIQLNDARDTLSLVTDKGTFSFYTDGDCCSRSWIAGMEGVAALLGSPIQEVADLDLGKPRENVGSYDIVQFYGWKIRTLRGIFVLEFRNESNGYYGGSLESTSTPVDLTKPGAIVVTDDWSS